MTENCDFERSVCLTVVLLPNGDIVLPMKDNKYTCFPKGLLNCAIASYKKLTDNLFGETELIVDEPNYKTMMLRAINNAAQPYIVDVSSGFLKYDSYEIADIGELRSTIYSRIFDEDYVDDIDCKKILDKFDKILKRDGLIVINVIEWLNEEKEIFDIEQLNPNYMTYINKYKKEFFVNYFENKNYSILKFFDNPFFNISKLKVKGKIADSNQFSIIVKKK